MDAGSCGVSAEQGGVVMGWDFQYTPYIWPMLASAAFLFALAAYTWRHPAAPGAVPLSASMLLIGLWALVAALEASSADLPTRLFWFRVKNVVSMPPTVTAFCFALVYAGLGGWITRRRLALLLVPSVAIVPLMFYDDSRILWTRYWSEQTIHRTLAPMGLAMNLYAMGLLLIATAVIASLFVRSPLHRAATSLLMLGHLGMIAVVPLETLSVFPDTPLDLTVLSADFTFTLYLIAVYRFHFLDVIPVARETVLERMVDGMLVLDARGRVADLNPAAQELLGTPRSQVLGRDGARVLAAFPDLARLAFDPGSAQVDVMLGTSGTQRWYQVSGSPLTDRRGFQLGRLMLFHDLTELKRAQQRMLEQQRALATLEERERVARELHDGLGQVLGYVKLQAQAARELLSCDPSTAEAYLAQLAAVAQDAHADVREYILEAGSGPTATSGFLASLERYLERYRQHYGIATDLRVQPGLDDEALSPTVAVQLLRIVQEALNNVRKHARASQVRVELSVEDGIARVFVADDGVGFDPARAPVEGRSFGLRFMRERAEQVGGSVEVDSAPGEGTRVAVRVPRQVLAVAQEAAQE